MSKHAANNRSKLAELAVLDLEHVTGGVVGGESIERNHRDMGGASGPAKPSHLSGSSWVGGKI
jgi:hypothetical protein